MVSVRSPTQVVHSPSPSPSPAPLQLPLLHVLCSPQPIVRPTTTPPCPSPNPSRKRSKSCAYTCAKHQAHPKAYGKSCSFSIPLVTDILQHRQFVLASYPQLKASNPDLKVLIREARGVEPRVFARFGTPSFLPSHPPRILMNSCDAEHGREAQTSVTDLSKEEVEKRVGELVSRG